MFNKDFNNRSEPQFERVMVSFRRVAKVTAGGKRLRFSAMVVVGDKKGMVGIALGRGADRKEAVEKAAKKAERNMRRIQLIGDTIPHEIEMKFGACRIIFRPAKPGTGVIAGSSVRTVLELAGIDNVYAKQLGSNDSIGNTYCTFKALTELRNERVLAKMDKMKERIGLKVQLDAEKGKREAKKRALKRAEKGGRDDKRDFRGGARRPFVKKEDNKMTENKENAGESKETK
jgi:small subunit ribosomal protein S5